MRQETDDLDSVYSGLLPVLIELIREERTSDTDAKDGWTKRRILMILIAIAILISGGSSLAVTMCDQSPSCSVRAATMSECPCVGNSGDRICEIVGDVLPFDVIWNGTAQIYNDTECEFFYMK